MPQIWHYANSQLQIIIQETQNVYLNGCTHPIQNSLVPYHHLIKLACNNFSGSQFMIHTCQPCLLSDSFAISLEIITSAP